MAYAGRRIRPARRRRPRHQSVSRSVGFGGSHSPEQREGNVRGLSRPTRILKLVSRTDAPAVADAGHEDVGSDGPASPKWPVGPSGLRGVLLQAASLIEPARAGQAVGVTGKRL